MKDEPVSIVKILDSDAAKQSGTHKRLEVKKCLVGETWTEQLAIRLKSADRKISARLDKLLGKHRYTSRRKEIGLFCEISNGVIVPS